MVWESNQSTPTSKLMETPSLPSDKLYKDSFTSGTSKDTTENQLTPSNTTNKDIGKYIKNIQCVGRYV